MRHALVLKRNAVVLKPHALALNRHAPAAPQLRAAAARSARGFTIIEIMITMVILAILAAVAGPSLLDMLNASRVRSAASDLYESAILARSEAIKRSTSVDVVPAATGWQDGWTVKVGTTVISGHDATPDVTITASASGNLTYRLDGRVSTSLRSFVLSSSQSASVQARCVVIDASGRAGIKTDRDANSSDGCD